ncbi:sigma-70 family RNA polymerase sigma factor [Microvirga sp. W0021]|uniref:RNA polymerase sigma factor n=1 Tax=Hohaiivirga grylli TaxID=3133970 RepID=A0ABV0BI77_9HYPH
MPKQQVTGPELAEDILLILPKLRAFATSLCGNAAQADDLVQETLVRAWSHIDHFEKGTNLSAWLFTILRNLFHSEYRKRRREVADPDGVYAEQLESPAEQLPHLELKDLQDALGMLSPEQREALILVGAEGFSYEDAASICGVSTGTIKSRVSRARARMHEVMGYE